jgi:hypothetical protein
MEDEIVRHAASFRQRETLRQRISDLVPGR